LAVVAHQTHEQLFFSFYFSGPCCSVYSLLTTLLAEESLCSLFSAQSYYQVYVADGLYQAGYRWDFQSPLARLQFHEPISAVV